MAKNAYDAKKKNDIGQRVPKGKLQDMRSPKIPSRVGGISGTGAGYGFGSGHAGVLRKGPHPRAPKNG